MLNKPMNFFKGLENSNTVIKNENNDIDDDDEIMKNIIDRINLIKYDFINEILSEMIDNSIFNVKEVVNKMERAEVKLLNKIYDKFGIQKNSTIGDIDIVYTYINYNDRNYMNSIKNYENNSIDPKLLASYKTEKEYFQEFLLNIELTKKNMPFIRNVYIITPTSDFLDDIEKYIVIPIEEISEKDKYNKTYFKPNNIVKYLTEINSLSNYFLFGNQDMICVKNIKKESLFKENIPIIHMQKKSVINDNKNKLEEYNTMNLFKRKFDISLKLSNSNQLTIIRKDVISFTNKLFQSDANIDFLLLQHLTGYFFYLYDVVTSNDDIYNGFYGNTQKYILERLNLIKFKKVNYFCMNYVNLQYIPFYLHSCFVNMGIIENRTVKNVFFIVEKNDKNSKYIIPTIEKLITNSIEKIVKFNLVDDDNVLEYSGKFGDCIYIIFESFIKKWNHLKHIVLEVNSSTSLNDILFFMNVDCKMATGDRIKVHYPSKVIKKLEDKYNIPFGRMLKISHDFSSVKNAKIIFKTTS